MRIDLARHASHHVQQRRIDLLHDRSLPLSVRGCINVHLEKPWIPNFWSVAIRAPKPGSESFFDVQIGTAEDGMPWFFPSKEWWAAHANVSHRSAGMGCDIDVHTNFLSREGKVYEFDYATIYLDGTLKVLGRVDFTEECEFWQLAFGGGTA